MCLPFLNLFVWYDALLCGWYVAYVGDASVKVKVKIQKNSSTTHVKVKVKIQKFPQQLMFRSF
jgi:hypothetical protein